MTSIRRKRPGPLQSMHIKPNQIIAWITGTGFSFLCWWAAHQETGAIHLGMYVLLNELPWTGIQLPHPKSSVFFRDLLLGSFCSYYSKRLQNPSFSNQRERASGDWWANSQQELPGWPVLLLMAKTPTRCVWPRYGKPYLVILNEAGLAGTLPMV